MIELRKISDENFEECIQLNPNVSIEEYVDSVSYSLAEAWIYYTDTIPLAIYSEENLVGFVSMYVGDSHYQIINFLIDSKFQNKGLGQSAARKCLIYLKNNYDAKVVSLPVFQKNVEAIKFWQKIGFEFSENIEDGYIWMRKNM